MTSVILNLKCNSRMATVWAGVARRGSVGAHEGLRTIRMPGMRLHHPEREEHQYYHPFFFFPFLKPKTRGIAFLISVGFISSLFFTTFQEGKKNWLLLKFPFHTRCFNCTPTLFADTSPLPPFNLYAQPCTTQRTNHHCHYHHCHSSHSPFRFGFINLDGP